MLYKSAKRSIDLLGAVFLLTMLAPLILIVGFAIKAKMGGPIIFSQVRPGKNAKLFRMYKFRTMLPNEPNGCLTDEERITPMGQWLRATSIDELPELINVIKGDMSLVGPRPLLVDYLGKYNVTQMQRHDVLPGITGLAQVRGRNELSWKNKFRYDVFYVKNAGACLDLHILYETIKVVLFRRGFKLHGEESRFDKK